MTHTQGEWGEADAKLWIRIPTAADNKYSHGVLGVVTGSPKYPGAAVLNIQAVHHTGIGMVRYLGNSEVANLILRTRPEIVTAEGKVDAWLLGSGMDLSSLPEADLSMLKRVAASPEPKVVDAGALALLPEIQGDCIITPHEGELERLAPREGRDLSEWAQEAASQLGAIVVLKGNTTFVCAPEVDNSDTFSTHISSSTTWLATAGTGDVLAGVIAAILATNACQRELTLRDLAEIAATGVWIHSKAAEIASQQGPFPAEEVALAASQVIAGLISG